MEYRDRFWMNNWDKGLKDLQPNEYDTTYIEMVRKTFAEFPNKNALLYHGVEITFSELDRYSTQFANILIESGLKKGDVVGINLPNMPEYVISVIGALKAGCIVSGVSPLLSADQIEYQLKDLTFSGKKLAFITLDSLFNEPMVKIVDQIPTLKLVIITSVASFLPEIGQSPSILSKINSIREVTPLSGIKLLDFMKDILESASAKYRDVDLKPDDLGWIQYTGGTTGSPKGAMLSHRNAAHNIISVSKWIGWTRGEGIFLSGFPLVHIAGLNLCECIINVGWTQILIPNPRDTDHICEEIRKYKPSYLANVPSLFQMLISNPKFKLLDHSNLEICMSGASPFPKESQVKLENIIGKGKLLEAYGMTETSPMIAFNPSKGTKKLGSIGMPFLNVDLKIINLKNGEEAPIGESGEICVKGPLVMQGYFNKLEETSKVIDEDGYLHTGDVGIMDEDGYIRIVDRTKDMIIVSGYKVFSTKVEDILTQHPAIGLIALIGVENPERPGSEIVKAFIHLDPAYNFDGDEETLKNNIINFAKKSCSPYEVPKIIEIVDEIPLTNVGKVDKKVLRTFK